jgi:NADPH-dependent glutamate synthase beta subunit-like oxidoreductase
VSTSWLDADGGMRRITPSFRPEQVERMPPCQFNCPTSGLIRTWIGTIAQRGKTGLSEEEAFDRAWAVIADRNPFPAALGRICPHPCESDCNRTGMDGAVSINAMERFLGDWAIERELPLPRLETGVQRESIGVIGAGPSGLSFAYQMARRGYRVTVYEGHEQAGGMLRYGVPAYRLPSDVLDAEVERIVATGVELRVDIRVGRDVTVADLRARHEVLYVAIGAQAGRGLGETAAAGEPTVWLGIDYLEAVNTGRQVDLGAATVVIGGGNTAIDAARTARRGGSEVTIVYRRSREEMPASEHEVLEAEEEGVAFLFLAAPIGVERTPEGRVLLRASRMALGEPDESGRRRPMPIPGSALELVVDSVIAAVSQEPVWEGLEALRDDDGWLLTDATGSSSGDVWGGGDVRALGIAGDAIVHGRLAAEALHARLRGLPPPQVDERPPVGPDEILFGFHAPIARAEPARLDPADRLSRPDAEVTRRLTREEFLGEANRCLSCGSCFGCEQCAMFCNAQCYTRVEGVGPGAYFALSLEACEECGKCVEVCPCGFLQTCPSTAGP